MKPKPLKNKCCDADHPTYCKKGSCTFKERDVASAVEFFDKYMDNELRLKRDFPKINKKIIKEIEEFEEVVEDKRSMDCDEWYDKYNRLLLKLAFEDVVEGKVNLK
jgi:hypothetical protein